MKPPITIKETLARSMLDKWDARVLLAQALKKDIAWLLAHDDILIEENAARIFENSIARRKKGEPLAYIVGYKECWGLDFRVSPDVLIPRPDTETLIEAALALMPKDRPLRVLDLGTGSGVIAVALAHERPNATLYAVDASEAALTIAQENAQTHLGLNAARRVSDLSDFENTIYRFNLVLSDWFSAFANANIHQAFDRIISNPPYIADHDPHLERDGLSYEPRSALTSGAKGLDALTHICRHAPFYLKDNGYLLLEQGYDQADSVAALMRENGFAHISHSCDTAHIRRVTVGQRLKP